MEFNSNETNGALGFFPQYPPCDLLSHVVWTEKKAPKFRSQALTRFHHPKRSNLNHTKLREGGEVLKP
jgi:hypothetical protein